MADDKAVYRRPGAIRRFADAVLTVVFCTLFAVIGLAWLASTAGIVYGLLRLVTR